jgi:hypothetical protein
VSRAAGDRSSAAGVTEVSPSLGGSFARGPRHNGPPDAAPDEQDQAVILAPGEPVRPAEIIVTGFSLPRIVRVGSSLRRGRSLRSRRQGDGRKRPPLTLET